LADMAGTGTPFDSLRFSGLESRRLAWLLALSLLAHLLAWGGYELGKEFNLWQKLHLPPLLLFTKMKPTPTEVQPTELTFVDVNPQVTPTSAPKNTRYFGPHNSHAANPEANRDTKVPQLNGSQIEMVKTEDTPRPDLAKPQPALQPSPEPLEKAQPQLTMNAGDLTLGKTPDAQTGEQPRPRTLQEALARQNQLPGQQLKQDGGVRQRAIAPSLDVKVTGFSDYDRRFISAVSQRWFNLLESQKFTLDRTGKVVLQFRLNCDGSISDMRFAENNVGDLLGYVCQKAVLDNAPFERWPSNMRLELGDYCDVQFTFHYNTY
jgi:hypothetical protein